MHSGNEGGFNVQDLENDAARVHSSAATDHLLFCCFQCNFHNQGTYARSARHRSINLAAATVGALLVGKVILVVDKIPVVNKIPDKPLIYNVVWKTIIYILAVFGVRYIEHLFPFVWELGNLSAAHQQLMDEVVWSRFWSIQIWLMVLFFGYASFHELVRLIGRDEVLRMFFGQPRPAKS